MKHKFRVGQRVDYHAVIGGPLTLVTKIRSGPHRIPSCPGEDLWMIEGRPGVISEKALEKHIERCILCKNRLWKPKDPKRTQHWLHNGETGPAHVGCINALHHPSGDPDMERLHRGEVER